MRKYLITGLLIWVPLVITIWVLNLVVSMMDKSLLLLPPQLQTEAVWGIHIPGLGVVLTLVVVFLTGFLTANFVGERLLRIGNSMLNRIPVVAPIYSAVKQVSDTLLSESGQAFRKALLVPYPHANSYTIAFLTGTPGGDVLNHLGGDYVSVYVPTTPNPTSGFFLMMRREDIVELDMSVDDALKYIISMGVVAPRAKNGAAANGLHAGLPGGPHGSA
jgi:uncharacterized membrane protein